MLYCLGAIILSMRIKFWNKFTISIWFFLFQIFKQRSDFSSLSAPPQKQYNGKYIIFDFISRMYDVSMVTQKAPPWHFTIFTADFLRWYYSGAIQPSYTLPVMSAINNVRNPSLELQFDVYVFHFFFFSIELIADY